MGLGTLVFCRTSPGCWKPCGVEFCDDRKRQGSGQMRKHALRPSEMKHNTISTTHNEVKTCEDMCFFVFLIFQLVKILAASFCYCFALCSGFQRLVLVAEKWDGQVLCRQLVLKALTGWSAMCLGLLFKCFPHQQTAESWDIRTGKSVTAVDVP